MLKGGGLWQVICVCGREKEWWEFASCGCGQFDVNRAIECVVWVVYRMACFLSYTLSSFTFTLLICIIRLVNGRRWVHNHFPFVLRNI